MIDFGFVTNNLPIFFDGLLMTLLIGTSAIVGALIGGSAVVALTMSSHRALAALGNAYVEVMRNTPVMVQIFVLYFGLPSLGLLPSAIVSAILALMMQNSAYLGEIYRAAIQSIPRRQMEAAEAVGMTPLQAMRIVIAPQAWRRALPPTGNQLVFILKDTSIASTIAVAELTHTSKLLLDRSAAPYEVFLILAGFYVVLTSITILLIKLFEWRFPVRA